MPCQAMPCHRGKRLGLAINKKNNKFMYNFYSLWLLLNPQGEYKRRRRGCERLWAGYDEPTRQRVFETLSTAKQRGDWINPNPYFAIEDTAIGEVRKTRPQVLSYRDYYARFHTTEPLNGWQMQNPTGNQVIYVKQTL